MLTIFQKGKGSSVDMYRVGSEVCCGGGALTGHAHGPGSIPAPSKLSKTTSIVWKPQKILES